MSVLTIPWTPSNGTGPANIIDAVQYNAVNTAIATAVNNIWPSQVLPTTSVQATFGATATGVGYKILANDATATPLTISGVTSQSVDIFDVTLTNGGTNAFKINNGGAGIFGAAALLVGAATPAGMSLGSTGQIGSNTGASAGIVYLGGATASMSFDRGVSAATKTTITDSTGVAHLVIAGAGSTLEIPSTSAEILIGASGSNTTVGFVMGNAAATTTSLLTGVGNAGSSGVAGTTFGINDGAGVYFTLNHASGNAGSVGTFTSSSSRELKQDFGDAPFDGLALVRQTTMRTWRIKHEVEVLGEAAPLRHGPIAEELPEEFNEPGARGSINHTHAFSVLLDAVKRLDARVTALTPA